MAIMGLITREESSSLPEELGDCNPMKETTKQIPKEVEDTNCSTKFGLGKEQLVSNKSLNQNKSRRINSNGVSSGTAIRSRFLNRLGISNQEEQFKALCASRDPSKRYEKRANCFQETLKGDHGRRDETVEMGSLASISTASTMSSCMEDRNVSFNPTVTVHPIAKRSAYSDRIRSALWTSPDEMRENTTRNCYEFAAESWDWRKVAEDGDMIRYQGQLVHPAHFVQDFSLSQRFSPSTPTSH
jgi:hypothetical protein